MKNIKKLTGYKGKDMLELIDRINALQNNNDRRALVTVAVEKNCGNGDWDIDFSSKDNYKHFSTLDADSFEDFIGGIVSHLFTLDSVHGYDWVEFDVSSYKDCGRYGARNNIDITLRRAN